MDSDERRPFQWGWATAVPSDSGKGRTPLQAQCASSVPTWPRQSSSRSDQTSESSLGQVRSSLVRYVTRTLRGRRDAAYRVQIKLPSDRSTAARASAAVPPRMRASTSRGAVLRNTLPCDCTRPVPASVATPSGIADGIGRGTRSTRTLALSGYSVSLVSRGGPTGTLRRACARRKDARDAFRRLPTRRRAPRQHALQARAAVGQPQDDG